MVSFFFSITAELTCLSRLVNLSDVVAPSAFSTCQGAPLVESPPTEIIGSSKVMEPVRCQDLGTGPGDFFGWKSGNSASQLAAYEPTMDV